MEETISIKIKIEVEGSPETKVTVDSVTIGNITIPAIVVNESN
jgi:hypothetical protein